MDGRNYSVAGYPEGFYVGGTLFDNVTPEMTIWREEIWPGSRNCARPGLCHRH